MAGQRPSDLPARNRSQRTAAPPSYSEIIARQSVIIAQHDSSSSSYARPPTPNSNGSSARITFRRVDYASSHMYGNSSGNINTSVDSAHRITDDSGSNKMSQAADPVPSPVTTSSPQTQQQQQQKAQEDTTPVVSNTTAKPMTGTAGKTKAAPLAYSVVARGTAFTTGTITAPAVPRPVATSVLVEPAAARAILWPAPIAPPRKQQQQQQQQQKNKTTLTTAAGGRSSRQSLPLSATPTTVVKDDEEKVLKKPSHHWDESSVAAIAPSRGCQQYLRGPQLGLATLQHSRQAGNNSNNGLLQALDRAGRGSRCAGRDETSGTVTSSAAPSGAAAGVGHRLDLLRAAVETAAREGAAKHGIKKSPEKTRGRTGMSSDGHGDPMLQQPAGSANSKESPGGSQHEKNHQEDQTGSRGLQAKQKALPFHHNHQSCRNWLSSPMSHEHEWLVLQLWPSGRISTKQLACRPPRNYSPARTDFRRQGSLMRREPVWLGRPDSKLAVRGSQGPPGLLIYPEQQLWPTSSNEALVGMPAQSRRQSQHGSWTNSNSWVAEEEKERVRWTKIQNSLYHAGMSESPFVPGNFAEYMTQRVERADQALQEAREQLDWKQAEWDVLREHVARGGDVDASGVLSGPQDASTVDVLNTPSGTATTAPFLVTADGDIWSDSDSSNGAWPSVAQLKTYGDQPARHGLTRGLPPSESLKSS
ncbi:hypothetical protein MN608_00787 [Microdochium nivale]|nr:hypothetical protein MN608_00787 [Microdochium nivale]